mgnify:FL=1
MVDEQERIFLEFDPNDYIIRLSPFLDSKGDWTGELLVGTVTTDENDMSDEDHFNLMTITKMVCASVPAMEEDDNVRDVLNSIVDRVEDEDEEETSPTIVVDSTDDNVINVSFNGKEVH